MSDYIDGDLTPEEKEVIDNHFGDCEKCRNFFHSFKNSIQLIEYLEINSCPPEVKERLDLMLTQKIKQRIMKIGQ
jgi:predicted anti-sigma-YlaC factor YlaD